MIYSQALEIAQKVKAQLQPHCDRIEIAGSIRRKRAQVKDIEIVAIPKPYDTGLFESGIATVINHWPAVKGTLPCKYTQRMLPEGIAVDIFFAEPDNWGYILAIRTGSADYSHMLATRWSKKDYHGRNGYLYKYNHRTPVLLREEQDVFDLVGLPYCSPEKREI